MSKQSKLKKLIREKRYDDFSKEWYHIISDYYDIEEYPNKFYKIKTDKFGEIDYYPQPDRLMICSKYQWFSNGLDWIKENLECSE